MLCDRVTSNADRLLGGLTHPCAGNSGGGWVGGDASSFPGLTRNSVNQLSHKGNPGDCGQPLKTSVLKPQGMEYWQQPCEFRG